MKHNTSAGQVSRILIILAVIVFLVIIIIFGVIRFATTRKSEAPKSENPPPAATTEPKKPVYETTMGDLRFVLESSEDLGNTLKSNLSYQSDVTTTEKFIKVTIGAQNKGKNNIAQYSWDVGNIVDSDGRNFVSINDKAYFLLPKPDLCGAVLKPEFEPVPCVRYYEVSKVSKGLKVVVRVTEFKKQEALINLKVQ